jgi:predicted RNA-binding Zn-ribbon protein involved in translation (DUF1610 family)
MSMVKRGTTKGKMVVSETIIECPNCGHKEVGRSKKCPKCGAKMVVSN